MYNIPNNNINIYQFDKNNKLEYNEKDWNRIIAIGDIHGCYSKLTNLLNNIQPTNKDLLIFLGDYTDRGDDNISCMKFIIQMINYKNIIFLLGNHELLLIQHILYNMQHIKKVTFKEINKMSVEEFKILFDKMITSVDHFRDYLPNGGNVTLNEVKNDLAVFKKYLYIITNLYTTFEMTINNQYTIFVHAGIDPFKDLNEQLLDDLVWIRWKFFNNYQGKEKIVIGHTPTYNITNQFKPTKLKNNIIMCDTGSYRANISAVNIKTEEYWQNNTNEVNMLSTFDNNHANNSKIILKKGDL